MQAIRKIAKNTLFIFSAKGLETVSNLIQVILVARYLGVEDFGRFSLLMAIGWVLYPILLLGLPRTLCRDIAKRKETAAEYTGTAMALNGLSVVPVMGIAAILAVFFKLEPRLAIALLIVVFSFLLRALREIFASVFIAYEQMEYETLSTFATRAMELSLVLVTIFFDLGFIALFVSQIVANVVGLCITFFVLRKKFVAPKILFRKDRMLHLLKESMPLAVVDFSMLVSANIDIFVLKAVVNDIEVGLFQVSQKIFLGFLPIPVAFSAAILPFLSSIAGFGTSLDRLTSTYIKIFKLFLVFGLFISIPVIVFAPDVIRILFGAAYSKASVSLIIVMFGTPFLFVNMMTWAVLVALNRQRYLMVTGCIFVVVNFVFDLLLVPRYGYIGASIATLTAGIVLAGTNFLFLMNLLQKPKMTKTIGMPVLVAIVIGLLLSNFASYDMTVVIPVYLVVSLGALYVFKIISLDEIQLMKQLFGKKGSS